MTNTDQYLGQLLKGKKGLITGIANNLSIAWEIAQLAKAHEPQSTSEPPSSRCP